MTYQISKHRRLIFRTELRRFQVRGELPSQWRYHHGFFEIFRIKIQVLTIFSLFYRYTHGAWERKMYSLALIYIQGCKCRDGVKCLWKCELMRVHLPWVLFYIPLMLLMCDANYLTWKYRQYRRYHVIFARKYKTLENISIPGTIFNSSGTPLFFFPQCSFMG